MNVRYIHLVMALLVGALTIHAQHIVEQKSVKLYRISDSVRVTMPINLKELMVDRKEILLIRLTLATAQDTMELPSVGIYGRDPYYYFIRSGNNPIQEERDYKIRDKNKPEALEYCHTMAYEPWMDRADVQVTIETNRLCLGATGQDIIRLQGYGAVSQVVHEEPIIEVSKGVVEGRAYVDFVLNRTEIKPEYHNNKVELYKIDHAIDSLLQDSTVHITSIEIKGWASPEGPYQNNVRLARGRSKSLRDYVISNHGIDSTLVSNTFEPEDWPGLRQYVESSSLPHRKEILDIIDSDLKPDPKLLLIKKTYKEDYADIFENSLPYLRHSDYTIDYEYRKVKEIEKAHNDTIWQIPTIDYVGPCAMPNLKPYNPAWALKTNLLLDAALCFNFEVEIPFGRNKEWSIMAEDWFPWYVWHHNSRAYELWAMGLELRRWLGKCYERPLLTGTFVGAYAAGGKYDFEWNSNGDQGEFFSFGGTFGRSWVLSKRWNFELSASVGVVFGPRRHYHGEFDDEHLIWQRNANIFYIGPTKLKASLVWLLENPFQKKKKKALFNILTEREKGGRR